MRLTSTAGSSAGGGDMTAAGRTRIRVESAIALTAAALGTLTVVWKDWVEAVFRVDPDGHSGAVEVAVVLGLFALALLLGSLAGLERHRARVTAARS
jgi:hypothetical protein